MPSSKRPPSARRSRKWPHSTAKRRWRAGTPPTRRGDLRFFLTLADDLQLATLGRGPGLALSYGAYRQPTARCPGRRRGNEATHACGVDLDAIREDATHAWLAGDTPLHPREGHTEPRIDKPGGYTWNKAPRLAGRVVETGAIARQLASGHPLIRDAVVSQGTNVRNRVLARLLEVARVLPMMEAWLAALAPREAFFQPDHLPADGEGVGLTEAARGALGHWLRVQRGRIANYQIVAPTSWNFSPRDAAGTPGALEAALVGAPVLQGEDTPVAVQHVVRSFDPCMVCTVH